MAIVTQTLLESRIGTEELIRLTDDAATGDVNTTVLDQAIAEGEAEINVRLGSRYVTPPALTDAATRAAVLKYYLDCVVYALYRHRNRNVTDEAIVKDHDAALAWAKDVGTGKLLLAGETLVTTAGVATGGVLMVEDEAVFSRESMKGL